MRFASSVSQEQFLAEMEWSEEDTDKLGLSRIDHELALFAWRNGAWEKVKSWPVPPALQDPGR